MPLEHQPRCSEAKYRRECHKAYGRGLLYSQRDARRLVRLTLECVVITNPHGPVLRIWPACRTDVEHHIGLLQQIRRCNRTRCGGRHGGSNDTVNGHSGNGRRGPVLDRRDQGQVGASRLPRPRGDACRAEALSSTSPVTAVPTADHIWRRFKRVPGKFQTEPGGVGIGFARSGLAWRARCRQCWGAAGGTRQIDQMRESDSHLAGLH